MAWIRIIPSEEGGPELLAAYEAIGGGRVPAEILGVHSVRPRVMRAHNELYREIMFGESELSRADREVIAVAVSRANDCFY